MKGRLKNSLLSLLLVSAASAASAFPDGSPEQALVEILTASKPEAVERHLPQAVVEELRTLDEAGRRLCEQKLLIGELWRQNGTTLRVPEDGQSLLVIEGAESNGAIRVRREIMGGDQAMLQLVIERERTGERDAIVWMQMEDGDWRVTEVQLVGFADDLVLDKSFPDRFRDPEKQDRESSAIATLNQMRWGLVAHSDANPETGFPLDLSSLASTGDDSDSQNAGGNGRDNASSSGFLDSSLALNDFTKDGYVFHYQLLQAGPEGDYSITARPAQYGKTGSLGFFMDSSGIVRGSRQDREPTVADDPHDEAPSPHYY